MTGLLLALSLTGPAHAWTELGEKHGCAFSKQDEGDIVAMRAQCSWDIPADKVHAWMNDWDRHDQLFGSVAESSVLGTLQDGKGKVLQVHQASGISDREVVMDVDRQAIDGGFRYTHTKSADQSAASGERVEVGRDDGLWEVKSTASGGCTVLYELRYDPAGKVPGFMVKWFQGSGFKTMLEELKTSSGG